MNRFVIADSTLYIGCRTCKAVCSGARHRHGPQSMPHLKMMLNEEESVPQLCHQCGDAPCATVYPISAISRVDDAVQLDESLYISCRLCRIACPFGAIEFSGSHPLHVPADANTSKAPPAPPAPARMSSLLDQVPGVRAITVKCDLCSFSEQGPARVRMCPTKSLHLVSDMDITRASRRKRELVFSTDFDGLILFQQVQSGDAR